MLRKYSSTFNRSFCYFFATLLLAIQPAVAVESPAYRAALNRVLSNPADAEASFQLAQIATNEGDIRSTISALERILILNPDLDNIKLELGILYLRVGSTALAERFINDALKSPNAPPEIRARAREFLDIAQTNNDPWSFSGAWSAGIIADSNANSGPTSGVIASDTGQSDASLFFQVGGELSYDLGTQAGHRLVAGLNYYGQRYSEQNQINIDRLGLVLGAEFNLAPSGGPLRALRLTLNGASYRRDNELFLTEIGPRATLAFNLGERRSGEATFSVLFQDFENTTRIAVNDERDGELYNFGLLISDLIDEKRNLTYGFNLSQKDAAVSYESYQEATLQLGYSIVHPAWFSLGEPQWRTSFNAQIGRRKYDGPDTLAGFTSVQHNTSYRLTAGLEIPLVNRMILLTEIGVSGNNSNYSLNTFRNEFVSIGVSRSF